MAQLAIAITALGMVTPLGLGISTSCAAARAGVSRAKVLDWLEAGADQAWGGGPIVGHAVEVVNGATGLGKITALGLLALKDLLKNAELARCDVTGAGMLLNLSDRQMEDAQASEDLVNGDLPQGSKLPSEVWRTHSQNLISLLAGNCNLPLSKTIRQISYGGRTGFIGIVEKALSYLQSGELTQCIVGAIDSLIDPPSLRAAHALGILKAGGRAVGFLPGEAAGFLLLEAGDKRPGAGKALGRIACTRCILASNNEPPAKGQAISQAIDAVLTAASPLVLADLNGEDSRGLEWGYTQVHLKRRRPEYQDAGVWLPAQYFGEVGAASGAIAAGVASCSLQRNYAGSNEVIAWFSSHTAETAAMRIESC